MDTTTGLLLAGLVVAVLLYLMKRRSRLSKED
jgi:hypothetical protein